MIKSIGHFLFVFLYFANIGFVFFPGKLRTKLIIGICGILFFFFHNRGYKILVDYIKPLIPLFLWMLLSFATNQTGDYWFLQYSILQIPYLLGGIMIAQVCGFNKIEDLAKIIVAYVLFQNTIAFAGLISPSIMTFIQSLEKESIFNTHTHLLSYRAIGFGDHYFFGGGIWSAIGMLFLTFLYKKDIINTFLFYILFGYIFLTGLYLARTAVVGLIALAALFIPLKRNWYKLLGLVIVAYIGFIALGFLQNFLYNLGVDVGYAFELYNNFSSTGSLETSSSDKTAEMWNVIPNNIKTWIIGDARYIDPKDPTAYYMHTDVGFLRVIWYGGLVGLFFYLRQLYKYCILIINRYGKKSELSYTLILYFILTMICLWKGLYDTSCVLYLFLGVCYNQRKYLSDKRIIKIDKGI